MTVKNLVHPVTARRPRAEARRGVKSHLLKSPNEYRGWRAAVAGFIRRSSILPEPFARNKSTLRLSGLKAGVCSGLILSGAFTLASKGGVRAPPNVSRDHLFREDDGVVSGPNLEKSALYGKARLFLLGCNDCYLARDESGKKRNVIVENCDLPRRGARDYFFRIPFKKRFFDCIDPEFHIHKVPIHHSHILKNVRMIGYYSVTSSIPPF